MFLRMTRPGVSASEFMAQRSENPCIVTPRALVPSFGLSLVIPARNDRVFATRDASLESAHHQHAMV